MKSAIRNLPVVAVLLAHGLAAQHQAGPKTIAGAKADSSRSLVELSFPLKETQKKVIPIKLTGSRLVRCKVASEQDTNVDLFVFDADSKLIAADTGLGKDCDVQFIVERTGAYRVVVLNLGKNDNRVKLTANESALLKADGQTLTLEPKAKADVWVHLREGRTANIRAISEQETDVDLFVYDATGLRVASDLTIGKDCFVPFTPKKTQAFRMELLNRGARSNRARLDLLETDPARPPKTVEKGPFPVPGQNKEVFKIPFRAGQPVEMWVKSTKETDVDLYVFDAADKFLRADISVGKDSYVNFIPAKTEDHRVEVRNLGKPANECTLSYRVIEFPEPTPPKK